MKNTLPHQRRKNLENYIQQFVNTRSLPYQNFIKTEFNNLRGSWTWVLHADDLRRYLKETYFKWRMHYHISEGRI